MTTPTRIRTFVKISRGRTVERTVEGGLATYHGTHLVEVRNKAGRRTAHYTTDFRSEAAGLYEDVCAGLIADGFEWVIR